jgi:ABC-type sulfate transport system permease component
MFAIATVSLITFLVIFLPLASSNPDGLEKVVETYGAQESEPFWNGLLSDYSISAIGNSYASTLAAGSIGTIIVLAAGLIIGKVMTKKNP